MVPVVTVVTANHGAPVIRLVAPRTDPDLIPPLISDLRFLNGGGGSKNGDRMGKKTKRGQDKSDYFLL